MARDLAEINTSGELLDIKIGGTDAGDSVATQTYAQEASELETDVTTILSEGDVTSIKKGGAEAENEVITITEASEQGLGLWKGNWVSEEYKKSDMVFDNGYLMIANKVTTERAAPQVAGPPYHFYDGTISDTTQLAKQVIFGTRYTPSSFGDAHAVAYRVLTKAGQRYQTFLVLDPLGSKIIVPLHTFEGFSDGWETLSVLTETIVDPVFDLIAVTTEPDPTPVSWVGDWQYTTPWNPGAPPTGQIIHAENAPAIISINYTDNNAGDRTTELQALSIGDIITDETVRWVIQSANDQGTYIDFGVSPATNGTTGTKQFSFETVSATPIAYGVDTGYYTAVPEAKGLYGADVDYGDIVPDNNAYGMDIWLQDIVASEDWEIMATGQVGGSVPESSLMDTSKLYIFNKVEDVLNIPQQPTWTPIVSVSTSEAIIGQTYEVKLAFQGAMGDTNDSMYARYRLNGGDWNRISKEAKDSDDTFAYCYFFPIIADSTTLSIELEASKEAGGQQLDIYFADAVIDQKS